MIASDDNNPNFIGAHNPDDRLHVRFYKKTLKNEFESAKQGRPIFYEADFVFIHLPGDKNTDIDTFVNDTHKARFPRQWAHYMNNQSSDSEALMGTPIAEWPLISRSQAEELRHIGFRTVDSIAAASDAQLQSIGMRAGMQPHAFREKARRWLDHAKNDAAVEQDAAEKQALRDEAEATKRALAELQAQMAEMQQRGKPGPKPRVAA
jgi:hypothetical protein